jgi:hypothetical protein
MRKQIPRPARFVKGVFEKKFSGRAGTVLDVADGFWSRLFSQCAARVERAPSPRRSFYPTPLASLRS